jgi:serine phosphatase RsbU (regulator of sigma subunit)
VTLVVSRIDRDRQVLDIVSAGHPPVILLEPDRHVKLIDATGPIVSPAFGLDEWDQESVRFDPASMLLIYTDGITDAAGAGERFSRQRLVEHVRSSSARGGDLLESVLDEVRAFARDGSHLDDLTLLTASFADERGVDDLPKHKPL